MAHFFRNLVGMAPSTSGTMSSQGTAASSPSLDDGSAVGGDEDVDVAMVRAENDRLRAHNLRLCAENRSLKKAAMALGQRKGTVEQAKKMLYGAGNEGDEWKGRLTNFEHWVRYKLFRHYKVMQDNWAAPDPHQFSIYSQGMGKVTLLAGESMEIVWVTKVSPVLATVHRLERNYVVKKMKAVAEGATPFDHGISDEILASEREIADNIDAEFIKDNYINAEFLEFAVFYGTVVSHDKGDVLDRVRSDGGTKNIMKYLSASDLSYAIVVYVNHKENWGWAHRECARKKANKALAVRRIALLERQQRDEARAPPPPPPPPRSTRRNNQNKNNETSGDNEEEDEEEEEEEEVIPADEPAEPHVRKLWHVGNRSKGLKFGLTPCGRALYKSLKQAFRDTNKSLWDAVWEEYWDENKEALWASPRKRQKTCEVPALNGGPAMLVSFEDEEGEGDMTPTAMEDV